MIMKCRTHEKNGKEKLRYESVPCAVILPYFFCRFLGLCALGGALFFVSRANWQGLAGMTCIFVLTEVICSTILVRWIFSPLRKLANHASAMVAGYEKYASQYELVDNTFGRLERYVYKLRTIQYRYRQNAKKEILRKLLYGDGSQVQQEEMQEAGILWSGDIFCVASVSFNHLEELKEKYSFSDMKLFSFVMINILEEYLRNAGFTVYGVDNEDHSVSIIIQLTEAYEQSEEYRRETFPLENVTGIQRLLYNAKQEMESILSPLTVFIGVGRSVNGAAEIHRSWLDTQYATIYRFTRGDQLITLFTPHMESYESGIQYPWDIEKKLLSNMKMAREETVLLTLEEFFLAVEKMAPDEMRWAFNQIMTSVFRIGMANNYRMKDGSPLDWKCWVNELNATDTKYEMKEILVRLLKNLLIEEEDYSGKKRLADSVKIFVDDHFFEEALSVSDIASHMGYSINYVRQAFKEMFGMSVSDYVLEKRIEKAQELLVSTNYTSKKIAQMVGYPDNRYFYVVFKKRTGETAENFRKKQRTDEN